VVIGVLVVLVIASILTGLRKNIVTMIEDYGTNNIFAFHLSTGPQLGPRDRAEFRRRPLRPEDGEAIRERAPAVEDVAHTAFLWLPDRTLSYRAAKYKQAQIEGVSTNYLRIVNFALREGRFFTEGENDGRRNVMVIGKNVAEALF
jgi:putative ABC transport system permease protein